ncbi:MAG: uroporphyrinogen decarboxylase family protein [Promethearchaeota archaeon]
MNGKERLLKTFNHEPVDKVVWVPFAGIHAGKLKGYFADELLTDGDKLFESLIEVNRLYSPDGQPVLFDLQIEAEILGCQMKWAKKSPPSVSSHPLALEREEYQIPSKIPDKSEGRLPLILDVMKRFKEYVGESTALFGLITGPLTLASHLRGTQLFLDMIRQKEYCKKLFAYCTQVALAMTSYYIEAGMDVIAIVDPVISQISPRTFKSLLHEPFSEIFRFIKTENVFSSFFVCGDATKNIEPMCHTHPDSIFVDENVDLGSAKTITDQYNIIIGGNIPLTSTMLHGTQQDNMSYVIKFLDSLDHQNLILAPGCDMPYDVPPENVIGVVETLNDPEKIRQALETYEKPILEFNIVLPDYKNLEKPLIEVFTLDSEQCAACTYMKHMAFTAKEKYGNKVEVIEYKWTILENIERTKLLGLRNLPSIMINGELKWSSIIPDQEEYFAEIQNYM